MIYAIILIVLGLIAYIFNKEDITLKTTLRNAILAPIFMIWGLVGIIILSTIRSGVYYENSKYWILLILGSTIEILIGTFFIYRHAKLKKENRPDRKMFQSQTFLAILAALIGIATIMVK